MFRITVEEFQISPEGTELETTNCRRYEQVIDILDLRAVMATVNAKPRKARAAKVKTA